MRIVLISERIIFLLVWLVASYLQEGDLQKGLLTHIQKIFSISWKKTSIQHYKPNTSVFKSLESNYTPNQEWSFKYLFGWCSSMSWGTSKNWLQGLFSSDYTWALSAFCNVPQKVSKASPGGWQISIIKWETQRDLMSQLLFSDPLYWSLLLLFFSSFFFSFSFPICLSP